MIEFKGIDLSDEIDAEFLAESVRQRFTPIMDAIGSSIKSKSPSKVVRNLHELHRAERLYVEITGQNTDTGYRLRNLMEYCKENNVPWPEPAKATFRYNYDDGRS